MQNQTRAYPALVRKICSLQKRKETLHLKIGHAVPLAVTLLALGLPARLQAQARSSSADMEMLLASPEQTVFTASKKAQKVSEVPAAVTVITEKDIAASGAVTILDLLRSAPGVDVMEANRSVADVSIRGFNNSLANKLLIMVDGRSIYQNVYGNVFWHTEPLLLSRIKRIEIVRGPGSALYGANAFNGVINIITKSPAEMAEAPAKTSLRTLVGEQSSTLSEIQTSGGRSSDWTYSFGAGYNRTDGYGRRQPGQVRDSYTVPILTADVQKRFKRGTLLLSAGNSESTSDFNEELSLQDAKWHTSFVSLAYNEDKAKNPVLARAYGNFFVLNGALLGQETVHTYDVEMQQSHALGRAHSLVYGISYRHVQASTFVTGADAHAEELFALYAQDDFHIFPRTHLFAGIRLDDHSIYGTNFTPRLSLVHHLAHQQSLRLSYGTSFRNPSLANTFFDFKFPLAPGILASANGNRDLKPEKVSGYELGYRKEIKGGHLGANIFYNQVTGLISLVPTAFAPSPPAPPGLPIIFTSRNASNGTATGLELESEFRIAKGTRGLANYAYQDVEGNNGQRIDLSPQHKINLGIQADLGRHWDAYLGAHFVGSSVFHNGAIALPINAYTRVDARVGYRFGTTKRPWTFSIVATNLFDDKHLEFPTASIPGTPQASLPQRRTLYMMLTGKL